MFLYYVPNYVYSVFLFFSSSFIQALPPMVASLASYNVVRAGSTVMADLIQALDAAGSEWFGLNAKKHRISRIGNMKVGFLAFCSKCTESGFLPFAPIQYSPKAGKEGIEELRKVRQFSFSKCPLTYN